MSESRASLMENIARYICFTLPQWYSDEVFQASSIVELGRVYFRQVVRFAGESTETIVQSAIRAIRPKRAFENANDYYLVLCEIIGMKHLPQSVLGEIEQTYTEIFVNKRNVANQKSTTKIDEINHALEELRNENGELETTHIRRFTTDISQIEMQLRKNYRKCTFLKSQKEQIQYIMQYMNSSLDSFVKLERSNSTDDAKKKYALDLCKKENYNVSDEFYSYNQYVDISIDAIERPYALFFKIKLYTIAERVRKDFYRLLLVDPSNASSALEVQRNIPSVDLLYEKKNTDFSQYNQMIKNVISTFGIREEVKKLIEESICLRNRKTLLLDILSLYDEGKYNIFNSIVPTQIEGIFADYLEDVTTFLRFSDMNLHVDLVLKGKINFLNEDMALKHKDTCVGAVYPEVVAYFKFYFNDMVRNRIAHGRYDGTEQETEAFATELLMDLNALIYMISRTSETEKMYKFISNHHSISGNICGSLFNDLIGKKIVSTYDSIGQYNPIQIIYWIVNPYYERIDEQVGIKEKALELRRALYSCEFWNYVLEQLNEALLEQYGCFKIDERFQAVLNGMFSCGVSNEVKEILRQVNITYKKLKELS